MRGWPRSNELGKWDYVTGTALEQVCDSIQGSRGATTGDGTDAAQVQRLSRGSATRSSTCLGAEAEPQ